ncbi:MAG: VCBS repeat-containing protein, partial [Bacteroidota bacterium]
AKQKKIIQTAKIAITSLGGDAQATIDMIRSGNWRDYFTSSAPLSSAAPLSYTFRNLGDGSIASVTETDEYSISSCTERIAVPGPFDFLNPQTYNLGDIGVPMETHQGDFNGDGMADIVFNHKTQGVNTIKLAYGNAQGGFDLQPSQNHSVSNESWGSFETLIGDFNGDGQDDLAWNRLTSDNNQSYFALSQGGGSYRYPTRRDYPATGWIDYQAFVGDLDGNGKQELIWNILRINTTNRTYRGEWIENDSVSIVRVQDFGGSRWDLWEAYVGNVDGGGDDMIWNRKFGGNFTVFGLSDPNGGLQHSGSIQHSGNSFSTWKTSLVLGNNDTHTDLVFSQAAYNRNSNDYSNTIRTLLSDGNGGYGPDLLDRVKYGTRPNTLGNNGVCGRTIWSGSAARGTLGIQ